MHEVVDIDRLFPDDQCHEDILGGLEDYSDGVATTYFETLTDRDRDIVQEFASRYLTPLNVNNFAMYLAARIASRDPNRVDELEMLETHEEVARIRRFVEVFQASDDFFPIAVDKKRDLYDEHDNKVGSETFSGWKNFWATKPSEDGLKVAANDSLRLFDQVDLFIDDSEGAPETFDQGTILQKHYAEVADDNAAAAEDPEE